MCGALLAPWGVGTGEVPRLSGEHHQRDTQYQACRARVEVYPVSFRAGAPGSARVIGGSGSYIRRGEHPMTMIGPFQICNRRMRWKSSAALATMTIGPRSHHKLIETLMSSERTWCHHRLGM